MTGNHGYSNSILIALPGHEEEVTESSHFIMLVRFFFCLGWGFLSGWLGFSINHIN